MSEKPETRSHETVVEIPAPPETVWRGITEASEIVRWFAPEASVTPGEGGSMSVSWGPGMEGTSTIKVWEPGRHLRIVENRPNVPKDAKPVEVAVDYYLEAKGGGTVLRLVHSGFGTDSNWDREFESTHYGWMMYLRTLRHALTRHPGVPCRQALMFVPTGLEPKDAWARVMGPNAFLASGSVEGLKEGDRFHWRAANGDEISGEVHMCFPPTYIGGTIEQANDSLFGITAVPNSVMLTFMFYGLGEAEAQTIQSRWEQLVKQASTNGF